MVIHLPKKKKLKSDPETKYMLLFHILHISRPFPFSKIVFPQDEFGFCKKKKTCSCWYFC